MKEKYITPEMEVIEFECEDIITTSDAETEILKQFFPEIYPSM